MSLPPVFSPKLPQTTDRFWCILYQTPRPNQISSPTQEESAMRLLKLTVFTSFVLCTLFFTFKDRSVQAQNPAPIIGERPVLEAHVNQAEIEDGTISFKRLLELGEFIFAARWNKLD